MRHRPRKACAKHHGIGHFSRLNKSGASRIWKCSVCGVESPWTDGWAYFGSLSCTWCGCEPAIEVVTCSDACRVGLETPERG